MKKLAVKLFSLKLGQAAFNFNSIHALICLDRTKNESLSPIFKVGTSHTLIVNSVHLFILFFTSFVKIEHKINLLSPGLQNLQQENAELQAGVSLAQAQLETALEAHESQRRVMDTLNGQFAMRIQELATIHREIATALQS